MHSKKLEEINLKYEEFIKLSLEAQEASRLANKCKAQILVLLYDLNETDSAVFLERIVREALDKKSNIPSFISDIKKGF